METKNIRKYEIYTIDDKKYLFESSQGIDFVFKSSTRTGEKIIKIEYHMDNINCKDNLIQIPFDAILYIKQINYNDIIDTTKYDKVLTKKFGELSIKSVNELQSYMITHNNAGYIFVRCYNESQLIYVNAKEILLGRKMLP